MDVFIGFIGLVVLVLLIITFATLSGKFEIILRRVDHIHNEIQQLQQRMDAQLPSQQMLQQEQPRLHSVPQSQPQYAPQTQPQPQPPYAQPPQPIWQPQQLQQPQVQAQSISQPPHQHQPIPQPQLSYQYQPNPPYQHQNQPNLQPAPQAPPRYQPQPQPQKSVETWLGKNVAGIVASVLIFLGLVFLSFLVIPLFTDTLKIITMFSFSALLWIAGFLLVRRRKNSFTTVLLGCGSGAIFISILVTYLYFHALSDVVAFALLLVWMAVCFGIVKLTDSLVVSIITHLGMAISVCLGYLGGIEDSKVLLLLVYQLLSTVLIIVGNVLCCKKTYRLGLFASSALIVVAGIAMWVFFGETLGTFSTSLPTSLVAVAFILQFVGASVLSGMLFHSIAKLENSSSRLVLALANNLIWLVTLCVDIALLVFKLYFVLAQPASHDLGAGSNYLAFLLPAMVTAVCAFVYSVVVTSVHKGLAFPREMAVASVALTMAFAVCVLFANSLLLDFSAAPIPAISAIILPAMVLMGIFQFTKERAYALMAALALGIDLLLMLFGGYDKLTEYGTVVLPVLYLLFGVALLYIQYRQLPLDVRAKALGSARLITIPYVELALVVILFTSDFLYGSAVLLLTLSVLLTVFFLMRLDRKPYHDTSLSSLLKINELLLFFVAAVYIAFGASGPTGSFVLNPRDMLDTILYLLVAVVCLALIALRISGYSDKPPESPAGSRGTNSLERSTVKPAFSAFYALAFTVLTLAIIYGSTNWFSEPYVLSLVSMVLALTSIALGFILRNKAFRIYGLVLVMVCVLKLLVFDLGELNSILRVVAFIGGGIICFAISALYNFAVKRFDAEKPRISPTPPPPVELRAETPLAPPLPAEIRPEIPLVSPSDTFIDGANK
ncbi:MAG: DUF2339 domain-containing protein [Coriobacteriales bacterium]|jgi:uncharacterized membrane protein|nr:DUF2339 domain-containing protein [Coriobacteriales bacterium]